MTSRLGPRASGTGAGRSSPALRQQRELAQMRERQREISRSASMVSRAGAFEAAQESTAQTTGVITKGYIADSELGDGLARPLLAMPTQPVSTSSTFTTCGPYGWEQDIASAVFETVFRHDGVRQNVVWAPIVSVTCSDAATAGEVRFVDLDTGVPLVEALAAVSTYVVPAGSVDLELAPAAPGLLLPQSYGVPIRLAVQARVSAGTGLLTVAVKQSIGG